MPVPTLITQLDTAAANNSPPGTESARGNIDDYLRAHASFIRQVFNGAQSGSYGWAGTAGGTANALALTVTPAITAYSAGQRIVFKSGASANSGVTTVAVSGLTPLAAQVNGAACAGGEILADKWYEILVDASLTSCQLMKIGRATLSELGAAALAGLSTQQFSVANASTAQHAVALAQADARYAVLAGLASQQFSVANATTSAHAVALGQFSNTLGAALSSSMPGGLIIKVGTSPSVAGGGAGTVTFPVAFPNGCAGVVFSDITFSSTAEAHSGVTALSASQFSWQNMSVNAKTIYWIAIGW